MKKKLVGYCLWSSGRGYPKVGDKWCAGPTRVWVMKTPDSKCPDSPMDIGWRNVCRVEGYVEYTQQDGYYITNEPHKLFITHIGPLYEHDEITGAQILKNAESISKTFFAKINGAIDSIGR